MERWRDRVAASEIADRPESSWRSFDSRLSVRTTGLAGSVPLSHVFVSSLAAISLTSTSGLSIVHYAP